MTEAPLIRLPDFSKVFEITCDAPRLAIDGVLIQENHSFAYFSEKLNDARQRYSIYDKKFLHGCVDFAVLETLPATAGVRVVFGS